MNQTNPIDIKALAAEAKIAKHKETYQLVEKNQNYRIGIGARADTSNFVSFFVEVIINLSHESADVDLLLLEKALSCLKKLHRKGYALAYEDGYRISGETTKVITNPNEEYLAIKSLLKKILI